MLALLLGLALLLAALALLLLLLLLLGLALLAALTTTFHCGCDSGAGYWCCHLVLQGCEILLADGGV